ncbi:MAG TPA: DNA-3-methyladenine glycosylase 2 family protein, partial [Chitinophagaceae bacterium]
MNRFNEGNFRSLCDYLIKIDKDLKLIIKQYGYPPMWTRENSFATLILTILEQQVSLASAFAAFKRLTEKLPLITPQELLKLSDEELRQCSFTRQKIIYARGLADALVGEKISLQQFEFEEDDVVRTTLKKLKGIGDWTADIYLLHALRRIDIFPIGDLALVNALKEIKSLAPETTKEEILDIAQAWVPYRSIATMICWHYYIQKRNLKLP